MAFSMGFLMCVSLLSCYLIKRNKLHSKLLFAIGYALYTKTRLGYYYHKRVVKATIAQGSHSKPKTITLGDIHIHVVPVLDDNYSYIIVKAGTGVGVAIDPADPYTVQKFLTEKKINLQAILTTHKHWDHAGGNLVLKEMYPNLLVYGSLEDNPSCVNRYIKDEDCIEVGGMTLRTILTPGHTVGHVVYLLTSSDRPCLFSGDHLFSGGCGKVFEGSYQEMLRSLGIVKAMDKSTLVFPGHEYTFNNMKFALSIEPENEQLERKFEEIRTLRLKREPTVPSLLEEELMFNPFLRTDSLISRDFCKDKNELAVLKTLRKMKDEF